MTAVTIRGLISTTRLRAGDEVTVEFTDSIADLERSGYVEVVSDGSLGELEDDRSDEPENSIPEEVPPSESSDGDAENQSERPARSPRKRAPRKPKTDG